MYTLADRSHCCIKTAGTATFFRNLDKKKIDSCPVCGLGSFGVRFDSCQCWVNEALQRGIEKLTLRYTSPS